MVDVGFEPTKAMPSDLQSDLVDRLSNPPRTPASQAARVGFEPTTQRLTAACNYRCAIGQFRGLMQSHPIVALLTTLASSAWA